MGCDAHKSSFINEEKDTSVCGAANLTFHTENQVNHPLGRFIVAPVLFVFLLQRT